MLNYKSIKEYWSKFYADAFEDVKTFWKDYAKTVEQFYFKYCSTFDSTPQGNIGPVTEALMDEIFGEGKGFTIVCPAFPEAKRTIFNGHLFVGNELLSESGMRNHPLTPMTDANLVRVMQAQTQRVVGLVNYDSVRAGPDEIRARFHALQNQGIGIAVVDVTCNQDLESIALATADMPLVTAGSGLAIVCQIIGGFEVYSI